MLAHPSEVVVAEGGPGDDEEAVLLEPGHREVALDPAAPVEHLGVGHAPHRMIHLVVAESLQEVEGAGTADLDLGEGRLIEEAGPLARGAVLGGDGCRPVVTGPAWWGRERAGIRLEPVGSLPPGFLPEAGAELGQAGVGG